jgi:hypothetical protein
MKIWFSLPYYYYSCINRQGHYHTSCIHTSRRHQQSSHNQRPPTSAVMKVLSWALCSRAEAGTRGGSTGRECTHSSGMLDDDTYRSCARVCVCVCVCVSVWKVACYTREQKHMITHKTHTRARTHARMHAHTQPHTHTHTNTDTHTHTDTHTGQTPGVGRATGATHRRRPSEPLHKPLRSTVESITASPVLPHSSRRMFQTWVGVCGGVGVGVGV